MKNLLLFLIFISVLSCNNKKSNQANLKSEIDTTGKKHSVKTESIGDTIQIRKIETNNDSFLVDVLTKFDYSEDYYIPLSLQNEYSESVATAIENSFGERLVKHELESRTVIPEYIAQKYFSTNGLNELIVIDKEQKIVDTISRKSYEFYEGSIESFYVATYESPNQPGDSLVVISTNSEVDLRLNKTPEVIPGLARKHSFLEDIEYQYDEIFSQNSVVYKSDTISILSFGEYSKAKYSLYLYKNGKLTDSIINDYMAISSLTAVPLATENELTYIYSGFKPDTDWLWNGLMGINLKDWRFKLYERNRIKR